MTEGFRSRRVSSPGEALLLARMGFWVLLLPVLKRTVALPRLVRLMASGSKLKLPGGVSSADVRRLSAGLYRSSSTPFHDNCLERSLLAFRFLQGTGVRPELVVGVKRGSEKVAGHVWVLVDGRPVHQEEESLESYTEVIRFDADGRALDAPARPGT